MAEEHRGESPNARFLAGSVPGSQAPLGSVRNAFSLSMLAHGVGFLFILLVMSRLPESGQRITTPTEPPQGIVWIAQPGPGGGGGGGGNRRPEPPQVAERPGREQVTVPAAAAPARPEEDRPPPPPAELSIPAVTTSSGLQELPGVLTSLTIPVADSRGSGNGPGPEPDARSASAAGMARAWGMDSIKAQEAGHTSQVPACRCPA